jgi:hypothetical protein
MLGVDSEFETHVAFTATAATRTPPTHLPPLDLHQKYPARAPIKPKVVAKKIDPKKDSALARLSMVCLYWCADLAERAANRATRCEGQCDESDHPYRVLGCRKHQRPRGM